MIRSLIVSAAVVSVATLSLVACQPSGDVEQTAGAATPRSGDVIPATYDWSFVAHGGSGDLDFGDGDWAEGNSIFSMSCLPNTKEVGMSWGGPEDGEAVLTSGTATGTFQPGATVPTDHPVITALKASGAIDVGMSSAEMRLVGKDEGKAAILAFFDYCDTGKNLYDSPEFIAAAEAEQARAEAAETSAQAQTPAAPVVEAPAPKP